MAQKLANKFFQDSLNNNAADVSPVTEEEVSFEAKQVALLQQVCPHWFMKPGTSKTSGAIEQDIENEDQVLDVLGKYLKTFSNNQYSIQTKVLEYGLLVRRDCKSGSTSPDGVFQLMSMNNGIRSFYSL